ncbi:MAG: hypothetical protein AAFY29_14125 [Pseudomonadota bacterium]
MTAAILPAGHMAAPLASGTLFHLCPGDARSAQLLAALGHIPQADFVEETLDHRVSAAHGHQSFAAEHRGAFAPALLEGGSSDPFLDRGHIQTQGHTHTSGTGHEAEAGDESLVDASCALAGFADQELLALETPPAIPDAPVAGLPRLPLSRNISERWLRPSARSPPV